MEIGRRQPTDYRQVIALCEKGIREFTKAIEESKSPQPNHAEVCNHAWENIEELLEDIQSHLLGFNTRFGEFGGYPRVLDLSLAENGVDGLSEQDNL